MLSFRAWVPSLDLEVGLDSNLVLFRTIIRLVSSIQFAHHHHCLRCLYHNECKFEMLNHYKTCAHWQSAQKNRYQIRMAKALMV